MKNILTAEPNSVKRIGRTYDMNGEIWSALSGTGIAFAFTGRKLTLTLAGDSTSAVPENDANYARIAVYVNDGRKADILMDSAEKTVSVIDSEEPVSAEITVVKLSECAMSCFGIRAVETDEQAIVAPLPRSDKRIEIIGDSITCGYGVDDEDPLHHFLTSTEDVTRAYAYKTARLLGAEYSLFSASGYGIISGYTEGDRLPEQTIPQYYESLGFSFGSFGTDKKPQDIAWDFGRFVPDIIVINLGTNDDSYCRGEADREALYTLEYVKFLHKVRSHVPGAYILCTVGIMGQRIFGALQNAVNKYISETGDRAISTLMFDEQKPEDGLVADYHPTETTHTKAAGVLSKKIAEIMNW